MADSAALISGLADRYAVALFELAQEADALAAIEQDLETLKTALAESGDLQDLVSSPIYSRAQQRDGVIAVAASLGLSQLVSNLLALMAEKRRLSALGSVCDAFEAKLAEMRGEVTAEVTSARQLTKAQLEELSKKLKASVGSDVKLNTAVDETLIAGLVVKVGSKMVDTSIKSKLANIQNVMREVG